MRRLLAIILLLASSTFAAPPADGTDTAIKLDRLLRAYSAGAECRAGVAERLTADCRDREMKM